MNDSLYSVVIYATCTVGWILVWLPAVAYLFGGWSSRRMIIMAMLDDAALRLYYGQYFPSVDISHDDAAALRRRFQQHYGSCYGKRNYIVPLLLLMLVSGIGAVAVGGTLLSWMGLSNEKTVPAIAVSALMGAYMWVLHDQFTRLRSRDYSSGNVYNCVFRLMIGIPFGYALHMFAAENFGAPLAFMLGGFPTETLFTIARRLAGQKLGLGDDTGQGKLELEQIQNITRTNAERYLDDGISTIAELAWADPIDLSIRTNLGFNYVADCMSQALVWIYFSTKTPVLYQYSIRGAQEVAALLADANGSDPALKDQATQSIKAAAALLNMDQTAFEYTLAQVADDPYTKFLVAMWGQPTPPKAAASAAGAGGRS